MGDAAELGTAEIYMKWGLKERAKEDLVNVAQAVPEAEREVNNDVFLLALSMLARLHLETGDRERSADYVEQGLAAKADHADLLFLKALLLWDIGRHNDMFLNLMGYLGAVVATDAARYDYDYSGERVKAEAIYKLLPEAYVHAASRAQLAVAIAEAAARADNKMIRTVHEILQR